MPIKEDPNPRESLFEFLVGKPEPHPNPLGSVERLTWGKRNRLLGEETATEGLAAGKSIGRF